MARRLRSITPARQPPPATTAIPCISTTGRATLLTLAGSVTNCWAYTTHSPGEHQLDGEAFAAELHLVHQDDAGGLAVVGLLFRLGAPGALIQSLLDAAPGIGQSVELTDGPAAADYIPDGPDYYGYNGSLTTPPCTEGVRWFVMQSVGTVSQRQVEQLQELTHGPNNRPVQPIGNRSIVAVSAT